MPSEGIKKENSLVVDLEKLNKRKGYWIVKRCIDCIGALCGILLLFPVFLIVSLMIKYEDPKGPVLLNKSGSEETVKNSICTNFVLWLQMLKRDSMIY